MKINFWRPLAGLSLFLYAMHIIESALEAVAGRSFRRFIRHNTDHPIKGILSGTIATAILQSSSLVGLMILALVGAGVIQMQSALGVIFGANLGTTFTGWIVATIGFKLDLDAAALPLIGIGGILAVAFSNAKLKSYARMIFGIGLLLMGLSFMKGAVDDAGSLIDPATLASFSAFEFLLFGVIFSAIVQSSSATMMVTLAALNGGIIDLPSAAAVAIGADLGTTGTVLMGAVKGNAAKKRVAAGHFFYNLVTDILAFILRVPLLSFISLFGLSDILSLVAFHSLFNFLGILLFLPFLDRFAAFLGRLFKEDSGTVSLHLSPSALTVPIAAVEAVELETSQLLSRVILQNLMVFDPPLRRPPGELPVGGENLKGVLDTEDTSFTAAYERTKRLEGEILGFTTELQTEAVDSSQSASIDRCQRVIREAIHSSKDLKDILSDLHSFSVDHQKSMRSYTDRFRNSQNEFYTALFSLREDLSHQISFENMVSLNALMNRLHEELHVAIYTDIRSYNISEHNTSALFNVNRELFNSNRAISEALAVFLLSDTEIESLEVVASRVA